MALILLAVLPAAARAQPPDFSGVVAAAQDAVSAGEIPGVVVLVGRGERILLHAAWGARRLVPEPLPMTTDTIFDVASLTKPVGTTLAVMALAERGAVRLDAPLGRYLKEFRGRALEAVTIRRLLTHSAGLAAYPPSGAVTGGFPDAARALAKLPLDYTPGNGFQYSDTGFILLGELVRRVSGQPL
ncbi:MAG: beta-lactamase family protein, partial [Candidatus Rokubacteria bacterium]|nr:beta-lactamase family protein [Candidatus Rokubacteria bacterium]